ncbi:MAG TPA: TIM barrel protein [Ktedonobacteraceae bacterium]|jgi:hydroxypyruvate isomerase
MGKLKQSFCWGGFVRGAMTGEEIIPAAAKMGYTGAEFVPQEYWPLMKEHGLTLVSINGHQSIQEGLNRRKNHARIESEILAHLKLAEQWKIEKLIVFSGNRAGLDDAAGAEITAEGLRRVAKAAQDAGVTLIMELLNSKVNHKDYQNDHVAWGVEVCQRVDSPAVKLLYDIYHMQIMEGDIIRTIQNNHAYFAHYHTAGNPGRHEIDETQELYYPAIVRAILATGYRDFLGQEFGPLGDTLTALQNAFTLCDISVP